jgi:hypothetical protein
VNPTTLADRLKQVGMLSWGIKAGLIVRMGDGVRFEPPVAALGFVFRPLRYVQ